MEKLRTVYKTFIPFLLIFIGMLLLIFIMDAYAERLTIKPEVIVLDGNSQDLDADPVSWQTSNMEDRISKSGMSEDTVFITGKEAFRSRDYAIAARQFTRLKSRYPGSPVPMNYLGMVAVRTGKLPEAIGHFSDALDADGSCQDARVNLASVYSKVKRLDEAEELYLQAIENEPNDPDIYYNLGLLYMETQNMGDAIDVFKKSVDLASGKKKARAYTQVGIAKLALADSISAREDLNQAILLEPADELARINYARTFSDPQRQLEELDKIYRLNNRSFHANRYLGQLYEEEGELNRAEYHYRKALEQDPGNEYIVEHLADILINQGRMREANLVISGFIAGDTLPQAYFLRAKVASGEGDIESAIQLYSLAISKSNHNYPEANVNLAILRKERGNYKDAIRNYRSAIETRPNYSLAYYNLALIYTETDSTDLAIEAYKSSIRYDSTSFKSWYNLGQIYEDRNQAGKEIEAYKQALRINPGYTKVLLELGNAYLNQEQYQAAIEAYQRLLNIYPKYTKALFNLGLAYSRMGNNEQAIDAYEQLAELKPDHISGKINLAIVYARINQVNKAISVLEDAMSIEIANPDVRYNLALQYEKQERYEDAEYQFLKVIELDERSTEAYDHLLEIYEERGEAVHYDIISFKKSKALDEDVDFYDIGKNLHEQEQYKVAIEAYQHAWEMGDDNPWILYWTGKAYMDMERIRQGIPYFEQVLDADPEHKFAWYRLGQTYDMLGDEAQAEQHYNELRKLDDEFTIVRKSPIE
ncbi:MAG: tetratricopeptide repeat protein [Bacteroidales bacterium]|nr:tetratricopeptide repeat protein [Bacteroidales bacterium]MDT8430726.1 tetratricopeptide repeat protein [Bacteroidales bacterium]